MRTWYRPRAVPCEEEGVGWPIRRGLVISLHVLCARLVNRVGVDPLYLKLASRGIGRAGLLRVLITRVVKVGLLRGLFLPGEVCFLFHAVLAVPAGRLEGTPVMRMARVHVRVARRECHVFRLHVPRNGLLMFFRFYRELLPCLMGQFLF